MRSRLSHCSHLGRGGVPQEGTGAPEGPGAHEQGRGVRDSVVQEELAFVQKIFVRYAEV
jgi:hypothetical protein